MKVRVLVGGLMLAAVGGLLALDHLLKTRVSGSLVISLLGLAAWCELAAMSGVDSRERGGGPLLFLAGLAGTAYFLGLGWWSGASALKSAKLTR